MHLMRQLKDRLRLSSLHTVDASMLWCAFTMAFFGFLRISELVSPSPTSHDRHRTLLSRDVKTEDDAITVCIKRSKTDQLGSCVVLRLNATNRSVCPVRAYERYNHSRTTKACADGPLFTFRAGQHLTRASVLHHIRKLLWDHTERDRLNTHSFRIGAATTAADENIPEPDIMRAGRWKSTCVRRYIRKTNPSQVNLYGTSCLGASGQKEG
ncbi:uncharacterized protein LOC129582958 [Paramacrobiotus metropolitanus]|uniref:uncharacterized protein LOC129582958 n=1 Tax=Paramacrobiotus metropolitanus TaxID=2943436 RepID=UPI002446013C|nr:uncharacterized protein LOC129582958 [Paramacrobiotus metropolitanus]